MSAPLVSVIMPAAAAAQTISNAIQSVERCGLAASEVEIIIAPMDREAYTLQGHKWCKLRYAETQGLSTSFGEARNKAIQAARGEYTAFLNAHDEWSENYLSQALNAMGNEPVCFAQVSVHREEEEILRLPAADRVDFEIMSQSGSSLHPVLRSEMVGYFSERPSDDIMHSIEVLAINGGSAPVSKAPYIINLKHSTAQLNDAFSARVSSVYQHYEREIRAGHTRIPEKFADAAIMLLRRKSEINARYSASRFGGDFYEYVASEFAKSSPPPWLTKKPSFEFALRSD